MERIIIKVIYPVYQCPYKHTHHQIKAPCLRKYGKEKKISIFRHKRFYQGKKDIPALFTREQNLNGEEKKRKKLRQRFFINEFSVSRRRNEIIRKNH